MYISNWETNREIWPSQIKTKKKHSPWDLKKSWKANAGR